MSSPPVAFYKDPFGRVYLRGCAYGNTDWIGGAIFTLPVGYRPSQNYKATIATTVAPNRGDATVNISTSGTVSTVLNFGGPIPTTGQNVGFYFDSVSFRAA